MAINHPSTPYVVRLYERDERGKFWPCGKYVWDSLKRAKASLAYYATDEGGIGGIILRGDSYIADWRGMSEAEALRVSPVKIIARGN